MQAGKKIYHYLLNSGLCNNIQLFHACFVNSQNYAPRYRGQLNALLPEAERPRAIVRLAVYGTEGHSFDYSTKQA